MKTRLFVVALGSSVAIAAGLSQLRSAAAAAPLQVLLSIPASQMTAPVDGRMLLLVSADQRTEPRFQVSDGDRTAQVFGVDVEALAPGKDAVIDASVLGYPIRSLGDLAPGEYWVQGLLHVYETYKRSDGHTVKLPPDRGEGQQWSRAPGNFYSKPQKLSLNPQKGDTIKLKLDQEIPPITPPKDT